MRPADIYTSRSGHFRGLLRPLAARLPTRQASSDRLAGIDLAAIDSRPTHSQSTPLAHNTQAMQTSTLRALLLGSLCTACDAFAAAARPAHVAAAVRPALTAISMQTEPKAAETNAEAEDGSGGIRQLLGLKGAKEVRPLASNRRA